MPDVAWWAVTSGVAGLVLLCALLALDAGRRVGFHSQHGALLGLFGLSYWLLLTSYVTFMVPVALDRPPRVELAVETLDLMAWVVQVVGLAALVSRFAVWRLRRVRLWAIPMVALPATTAAALYVGLGPETPRAVQLLYMILDGVCLGLIFLALVGFRRVQNGPLGRLFLFLSVALGLKALGDVFWYTGQTHLADPTWLVAAIAAAIGWTMHGLALRRSPSDGSFAEPHLRPEQRVLRDAAREARGVAGLEGGTLVVAAACAALSRRGIAHRLEGDVVEADAPASVWADVLREVGEQVESELGSRMHGRFLAIARTFGEAHERAARGAA